MRLLLISALLFGSSITVFAEDEFECPPGAKDSGYRPGIVVRWCEIQKDGRLLYHGPVWRWHRNGQQESKENYVYGAADGDTPSWYENGKMSSHGAFKDGSKIGLWKYWDQHGRIKTEVTYQEAGHQKTDYYPTGKRKSAGVFVSTGKIGNWTYWSPDGKEKAQCDFKSGVFSITTEGCRIIANELDPKGYSRPIPMGALDANGLSVHVGNQSFLFSTPTGWAADVSAGKKDGVPLVLYPVGGSWRGKNPNLYVRVIFKDGASFNAVQKKESEGFEEGVAGYSETGAKIEKLKSGIAVVTRTITYKPLMQTDSPFSIVADNTIHESLSFVDASKELVLLAVLTSPSHKDFTSSEDALRTLVHSLKVSPK